MGTFGRVFSTKAGAQVTGMFEDFRGGVAGKNALYFATTKMRMTYNGREMVPHVETIPELIELNQARGLVVQWLKEQGLR